ncbi:MAG: matrixin family metalloprotease [Deltaproteobacteria bacterium]|nr:matrixin family metalloprotease [Deltaproteobacteria bacterium]
MAFTSLSVRTHSRTLVLALLLTPALAAAQAPSPDPNELLLKARTFVPPPASKAAALGAREAARHLLIQFEQGRMKEGIAALEKSGVRVLEFVPRNAVSAYVPAGFEPTVVPAVRWAGKLRASDKLAVPKKPVPEKLRVLVDVFPGVKRAAADIAVKRAGGRAIHHAHLTGNTLLVEIESSRLHALAGLDEVSFVYPASKAVETMQPLHTCPGAITEQGPVANYVANGNGWDGFGLGSASLSYIFLNGTPDVANEQAEVLRAMNTWSAYAAITWSQAPSSGRPRSLDILWASGSHGDPNPFDGPFGVLAHAYFPSPPNPEPIAGDMHFDEDELWTHGPGMDVYSVALHELGHALGLGHSADPGAVMYPHYGGGVWTDLASDDIAGIRALYAPAGGFGADSFEPDDTPAAARTIAPGSQQSHSIVPASDVDYARFTLFGGADVVIETSGAAGDDTRMWLYDANLNQIEFNDDVGSPNLFSRIDRSRAENNALPAGTYYVRVDEFGNNSAIASYNLSLQVVTHAIGDAYEPDDTASQAVPLAPGAPQAHSLRPANDGDYTRFSLSQPAEVAIETSGGGSVDDTRMWLFAQDLSALEYDDDSGAGLYSRIERTQAGGDALQPGTYYVLVDEFGNDDEIAAYDIQLTVTPLGGSTDDAYEENDDYAEAWDNGGVSWEGFWLSSLDGPGVQLDDDYYRIDVSPGQERVVATLQLRNSEGNIDLFLENAAGQILASSASTADREEIDMVVPAGGGTYFLVVVAYPYVGGGAGNSYDLWWDDLVPPLAPSNDAFASRITLTGQNTSTSANNASATKESGEPLHAGQPGGVSLWWSWTAPVTGDVVIDTAGSVFDTLLGVYTGTDIAALTHVASNDDVDLSSLQSAVSFRANAGTTYAIAVDGWNGANGALSLQISQQALIPDLQATWANLTSKCKLSTQVCKLKGKLLVRNVIAGVSAPAQVSFHLSNDNSWDPGDAAIGGGSAPALKAGKTKKVKLRARLPAGTTVSGKFVIARLTSGAASQTVVFGPLF